MRQRANAGCLLAAYAAKGLQGALWIDPTSTALKRADRRLGAYQQVIRCAPALCYFLLCLSTGDIMQSANCLCSAHQEQKAQRYRYELTRTPAQAPEGEMSKGKYLIHGTTGGGVGKFFS